MTDLLGRLPEDQRRILDSIVSAARRRGLAAYLVGGAVRDLLSRRRPRDLDVAVEGDAVAFARSWATESHRTLEGPSRFGTVRNSTLEATEVPIEFASTRREVYAAPAELPKVFPASIDEDLRRRDFTINAMAISISGPREGELLDPCGGRPDLRQRLLRLLHDRSIADDPTRAFRAARYAARLSFRIEASSLRQIEAERRAGIFAALSGIRLRRELELLLGQCGSAGLLPLHELRLASEVWPRLSASADARTRLDRALRISRGSREIDIPRLLLLAWLSELPNRAALSVADRLDLRAEARQSLASIGAMRRIAASSGARIATSGALALQIRRWTPEEAIAAASWLTAAGARRFLPAWRRSRAMRLRITGDDLIGAGLAPGPAIGRGIEAAWKARVEGRITPREELAFAIRHARR